ncbi:sodium:solute symporter family protein [bacterium AH-315-C07]|nr:sodium:solute symporter family protein [bacterium AH-315-C07]
MVYFILASYLLITLGAGFYYYKTSKNTPEDYFLAGRGLGTLVLFFTLVATNFSAFFFLGFAGAGYRIGLSYYAMMTFGTAIAGLSFYFIGHKAWQLGKEHNYITPAELIYDRSGSKALKNIFVMVMVVFTLPYLALQPIGAGYILSLLTNGEIPYFAGAAGLTVFIVFYVFLGGMRSVAITDLIQGILMLVLIAVAVFVVADKFGGITEANRKIFELKPELFSREGGGEYFTHKKWFSLMLLWILCLPMFPHMFMRFYISKDLKSLKSSTLLYTILPPFLFICPVLIGLWGHLSFPGLQGKEADHILPMMMNEHAPLWLAALVMVGALAAFMSTLDSQLLALSTIITRDVYMPFKKKEVTFEQQIKVGRILIVLLAIVGLVIAYNPADTIFDIAKQTFSGYAILFPVAITVLYCKKYSRMACVVSIVIGEVLILLFHYKLMPSSWLFGFEPIIPVISLCIFIIISGSNLFKAKSSLDSLS